MTARSFSLVAVALLLVFGACSDLPTSHESRPGDDATYACNTTVDGVFVMCPITPTVPRPDCDSWWSPDCGYDESPCMMSEPDDPQSVSAASCPDQGGGSPRPGPGGSFPSTCPDYSLECTDPETGPANDEAVDCADIGCKLRDPTATERQRVLDLINSLRTDGFCAEVRASALAMVNRHLQVWENPVYINRRPLYGAAPWDYSRGGQVMYLWTGAITAWTIAHEAIHGIWNPNGLGSYYTHDAITPMGMDLDQTAGYCSGH